MTTPLDDDRQHAWVRALAYTALAAVVAVGVWRRLPERPPEPEPTNAVDPFGYAPPPEPLSATPSASRIVRWCDVRRVLERRCQRCHTNPPQLSAPFPLLTYSDLAREYPVSSGLKVVDRMSHVIRYRVMPPVHMLADPPVEPLDQTDLDVLLVWLQEGALLLGGENCGEHRGAGGGDAGADGR